MEKALEVKYQKMVELLGDQSTFYVDEVQKIFPEMKKSSLYWNMSKLVDGGYLRRIRNGVYAFNEWKGKKSISLLGSAEKIRDVLDETGFDYYISGLDILHKYMQHVPEQYPNIVFIRKESKAEITEVLNENNYKVIIIGDLSWGTAEQTNELLTKLNGRLYLIAGNHDRFVRQPEFRTSRFTWIKPYEELSDNKRKVVLCHYPIMCYNGQYRLDEAGNPKTYMLYGHVHDTQDQRLLEQFQEITRNTKTTNARGEEQSIPCNMINCFCMYSDYEPIALDEWIALDKNRHN